MKRQMKNDKVVRSITIGISAMIALMSTPVRVAADELGDIEPASGGEAVSSDETVEGQNMVTTEEVSAASEDAGTAVADVVTTVENMVENISGSSESGLGELGADNPELSYIAEIVAANNELNNTVFGEAIAANGEVTGNVEATTEGSGQESIEVITDNSGTENIESTIDNSGTENAEPTIDNSGAESVESVTDGDATSEVKADAQIYTEQLSDDQSSLDSAAESVDDTCKEVVEKVGELNTIAHSANEAIEKSVSEIEEKNKAIVNADSVETAKNNLDSAEVIAADAQNDYEAARDNYDTKLAELNDAKLEAKKAQEDYAKAYDKYEQDIEAAESEWEEASKKLNALEEALNNADSLTKEEKQSLIEEKERLEKLCQDASAEKEAAENKLKQAQADKDAAEEALNKAQEADDKAKEELEAANKAVEKADTELKNAESSLSADQKAYNNLKNSKNMAEKIAYMESQRAADTKDNWGELDKLFAAIVENYYIANVYAPGAIDVKIQKVNSSYFTKYTNDTAKNYCTVNYKLDGVEKSAYFNYKREPGTNQIIIFEKTPELDVNSNKYKPTGNGTYEDYAQNNNTERVFFEFETLDDSKKSTNEGDDKFAEWMKDARNKVKGLLDIIAEKAKDVVEKQTNLANKNAEAADKAKAQAETAGILAKVSEYFEAKGQELDTANTSFTDASDKVNTTQKSFDEISAKIEDYSKKEIAYITALGKVDIAKNAVEEANDKLDKLRSQLQRLERNDVVSEDIINQLQLAIDNADELMTEAQNKKDKAEQEAQKARNNYKEAVDRINREIAEKEQNEEKQAEQEQTEEEKIEEEQNEEKQVEQEQTEKVQAVETRDDTSTSVVQNEDVVLSAIDNNPVENDEAIVLEDSTMYASIEALAGVSEEEFTVASETGDDRVADVTSVAGELMSDIMTSDSVASEGMDSEGLNSEILISDEAVDSQDLDEGVAGVRREKVSGLIVSEPKHEAGVAGVRRNIEEDIQKDEVKEDDASKRIKVGDIVAIEDEEVPLAATPFEEDKEHMNWWWLLIVAILGTTGYEMYRKHKEKKSSPES